MEKLEQLYNLVFSPIITPYNLLENAKLDNYQYVNYYKEEKYLVVEMKCTMEDSTIAEFYYYFDLSDKLQKALMKSSETTEIIFDRNDEIQKLKERIIAERNSVIKKEAI